MLCSVSHSACALLSRKNVKASAVCSYSLSVVQDAFEGPYMEIQGARSEWKVYTGKIPEPRPGTVNAHTHTSFIQKMIYRDGSLLFIHTPEK